MADTISPPTEPTIPAEVLRDLEAWITEANRRNTTYEPRQVRDRLLEIYAALT